MFGLENLKKNIREKKYKKINKNKKIKNIY